MTAGGARAWHLICEQLCAPRPSAPPSTDALLWLDLDVNMADSPVVYPHSAGTKRSRADDDDDFDAYELETRFDKRARPTSSESAASDWRSRARDSVLNTPKSSAQAALPTFGQLRDDSDDPDSMASEPGSPQDINMSSGDELMELEDDDAALFSRIGQRRASAEPSGLPQSEQWRQPHIRSLQTNRVATPILPQSSPLRPGVRPLQIQTGFKQHVRHRHPQENISLSSDLLEVPSPIDEDEVSTPPSAAEAAESQLSMLSVNDMDVEDAESGLPSIAVDSSQTLPFSGRVPTTFGTPSPAESATEVDLGLVVRKQRARSGALSSPSGSPSLPQADPLRSEPGLGGNRRVLSMGFRADCQKCVQRVPGHMNHFVS